MAKVIYRVLESNDKTITFLDEFELKRGKSDDIAKYWRGLMNTAKDKGLLIDGGMFENGVMWFKSRTKGGSSIRRYELYDSRFIIK